MGRYFDNDDQATSFAAIAESLMRSGAVKVGLTGSRADGTQHDEGHKGDVDIIALFLDNHCRTFTKPVLSDTELPDGTVIPPNFEVIVCPYHSVGGEVAKSMKEKAVWFFSVESSGVEIRRI
jgi:hypothetical protein